MRSDRKTTPAGSVEESKKRSVRFPGPIPYRPKAGPEPHSPEMQVPQGPDRRRCKAGNAHLYLYLYQSPHRRIRGTPFGRICDILIPAGYGTTELKTEIRIPGKPSLHIPEKGRTAGNNSRFDLRP